MALLPAEPSTYLLVNLITQPLALRSTQTAKVSCLLTSDVLLDFCRNVRLHTHIKQVELSLIPLLVVENRPS